MLSPTNVTTSASAAGTNVIANGAVPGNRPQYSAKPKTTSASV